MTGALVGIGVDLVEVGRVARVWERFGERFLARVFTAGERAYCLARPDAAGTLAGRFAAKEAVMKALSPTRPGGLAFSDVGVNAGAARPSVELSGAAAAVAARRGIAEVLVTISHERGYAVAFAVALAK